MKKEKNTFLKSYCPKFLFGLLFLFTGCDYMNFKGTSVGSDQNKIPLARVSDTYLYYDELAGIVPPGLGKEDSTFRIQAYVNSWIRKQLLIHEASRKIDFNEAEIERKVLEYRYSLIAYEYQALYVKQNLDTLVSPVEIELYYQNNIDNFILKQNIIRGSFLKVPQNAPRINKIKDLLYSKEEKSKNELKSFCLSFSSAYHINDSSWIVFDELVKNSPLVDIPNKIQFLKNTPYYETTDDSFLYFLKVEEYRISDNLSPLEFVKDEIRNIILNKRKIELAKLLEDEVYEKALNENQFEIFSQ